MPSKKTSKKKQRPITTRKGRGQNVWKSSYEGDLEKLEKINELLLKYKGTELYWETCQHAQVILRRVNEMTYQ